MTLRTFKISICILLVFLLGCGGLTSRHEGVNGKQSAKENRAKERIEQVDKDSAKVNVERLKTIGAFSYGIEYALNQDTNPPTLFINTALTLNERVQSLADKPSIEAIKEMQLLVSQMTSNNTVTLQKKDKQIASLQADIVDLARDKESAINKYMALSEVNAAKADQYKETLNDMDSFFGFGAITYGIKKLFTKLLWFFVIGTVLYVILRIASMSNPIAGALFSIIDTVFSWGIHVIKALAPKALNVAGMVEKKVVEEYKQTLTQVVDAIQTVKTNQSASMNDLISELGKNMDSTDKQRVQAIKEELNWK